MFNYPYFRPKDDEAAFIANKDTRLQDRNWAAFNGCDSQAHRRIHRFWKEEDKMRLKTAVNKQVFDQKMLHIDMQLEDVNV